jgi:polyphenol oxidase
VTIHLEDVDLGEGVAAWFTGRDRDLPEPPVGAAGNLSHRRPHRPADLARARREIAGLVGVPADRWHLMHQVHGAEVAGIEAHTPAGMEVRGVDALVTACTQRPLVVQVADCVPVLLAGPGGVAAVHAGRQGVAAGVVRRAARSVAGTSSDAPTRAAIGPAIGGCCYEVPAELREQVAAESPAAWATTRWGTPSLDLPAAVRTQLAEAGITDVERVGGCTFEDERFFSHRRDPWAGRQVGIVVKTEAA